VANLAKCPTVPRHRDGTMGQSAVVSVKALAISVLSASRGVPRDKRAGIPPETLGTAERESQTHPAAQPTKCGSPQCAGCYEVAPGVRIHPPKCGEDYRVWLERWEAKGRVQ
jgi:hypothetical protein